MKPAGDDTEPAFDALATIPSTVLALAKDDPATAATLLPEEAGAGGAQRVQATGGAARYAWLSLLGEGGMGRVERMRDRDLLREVAIKHVRPELRSDRRLVEQFLWEARVTAYLDHPNVVPVHDLASAPDGHIFFTMKLVRGQSLDDRIERWREDREPLARRLRLFLQVCNAVGFAHERGVLHRDLKPANILIGDFGEVLVGDWGLAVPLATAVDDLRDMAPAWLSTESAGTPSYMSPEQVAGDALDARSDIYALGVILYELTSLRGAFHGDSLEVILTKVRRGTLEPLEAVCSDAPPTLCAVVAKAMSLDKEQRYASVVELAEDIETVLDGRTPSADHASLPTKAARYYVGRDPAMSRLRVIDIDLWMASAMFFGGAIATALGGVIGGRWWALGLGAVLVAIPPSRRYFALRNEAAQHRRER